MAIEWVKRVNGKTIFPKLVVYLQTYREKYLRNQRIKAAVSSVQDDVNRLKQLNAKTLPPADAPVADSTGAENFSIDCDEEPMLNEVASPIINCTWPQPEKPPTLPTPAPPTTAQQTDLVPREVVTVGGVQIGVLAPPESEQLKRKQGGRSLDKGKRRKRRCRRCVDFGAGDEQATVCPGANGSIGQKGCINFDEGGRRKN